MRRSLGAITGSLVVAAGLFAGSAVLAAPARADLANDAFLQALADAGIIPQDPSLAAQLGRSVCPMLSAPGQNAANVAGSVADAAGMPLGPSTMFTGIAVSIYCPALASRLGHGSLPVPILGG